MALKEKIRIGSIIKTADDGYGVLGYYGLIILIDANKNQVNIYKFKKGHSVRRNRMYNHTASYVERRINEGSWEIISF
tara:strand:- start:100 stop:333 length:234 start_codon:yes stop_codon:yes gene_type:complete